jgi:hypothetical protein
MIPSPFQHFFVTGEYIYIDKTKDGSEPDVQAQRRKSAAQFFASAEFALLGIFICE